MVAAGGLARRRGRSPRARGADAARIDNHAVFQVDLEFEVTLDAVQVNIDSDAAHRQGLHLMTRPVRRGGAGACTITTVPGFPSMAWPMVEWVLDTQYRHLFAPGADIELTVMAEHAREGDLIDLMQQMVRRTIRWLCAT